MSVVKESKQYAMTVVPHRPYVKAFRILLLCISFVLAVAASHFAGRYYNVGYSSATTAEYAALNSRYKQELIKSAKLEQQIANLKLATDVDRKANTEVRAKVVELETQLADLKQNNTFYRSLMRPAAGDKGIVVDAPSVVPKNTPGEYTYNIVVKQIVAQHQQVSGYLTLVLVGKQSGETASLSLKDISDDVADERIRLNFKYFQRIEGDMTLPKGFVPDKIEMQVVIQNPKKAVIDKKFGWLVKES
jgi:septal ring factor EnvC (AmiA/AmiB activator)